MWIDFSQLVKKAQADLGLSCLVAKYNGDKKLRLEFSPRMIKILPEALLKSINHFDSLEHIQLRSKKIGREIPFACLIDESTRFVIRTFKGAIGAPGFCCWESGSLLSRSMKTARASGAKVMLGHTHPAGFGAICSDIYYRKTDRFGADYLDMLALMKEYPDISRFHLIMSPLENQLGLFELKDNGCVIYHPWKK